MYKEKLKVYKNDYLQVNGIGVGLGKGWVLVLIVSEGGNKWMRIIEM